MKCGIVFVSCVLAVASAGYSAYGPSSYAYQNNVSPVVHGGYAHGGNYGAGAPLPVQDTHEVAAAKAAHFQAHAIARGQAHASPLAHGYAHAAPVAHGVNYGSGAPLPVQDTYEVAAAKAAHFQAHAAASGQAHAQSYASSVAHGYAHAAPVAHGVNYGSGAPLPVQDTYEVAAAKAAHFQAHAAARGQAHASPLAQGYAGVAHGYAHAAPVSHGYAHAAPVSHGYAHGGQYGSEARLVDPVAIAAGAPLPGGDTYEVAAAKAAHLQAHAAAKSGHLGLY